MDSATGSAKHRAVVDADVKQGQSLGITATPSFLINGILLSGAQPLDAFAKIIDSELELTANDRPRNTAPTK